MAPNSPWKHQRFRNHSTRYSSALGMNKMATDGLLRALLAALNRDFMTGLNPEILLPTETTEREMHKENISTLF
jgi:hypothetical protein